MAFGNSMQQDDNNMMSEINVTPLVDVMLVLLVIFIVTAPLLAPQALKVNLPKTDAVAMQVKKTLHGHLGVNAAGEVELDGKAINDIELAETLRSHGQDAQFRLQIEADERAPYGRIAGLMALAQKAGVTKLSFVTLTR